MTTEKTSLKKRVSMKRKIDKQVVYEYLATIPKGRVVTYGQIAKFLGNENLARTVGNILHENPDGDKYPCYKVVNAHGKLAENYAFGGIENQKIRLEADRIIVNNNKVDLKRYQWNYEYYERGELPEGSKRGILSQDGLYTLLSDIDLDRKK